MDTTAAGREVIKSAHVKGGLTAAVIVGEGTLETHPDYGVSALIPVLANNQKLFLRVKGTNEITLRKAWGADSLAWVGKTIGLEIGMVNGREVVIVKPVGGLPPAVTAV